MITQNPEKAVKLNTLIDAVFGENSMHTGGLRALVQEITQVDLCPAPPIPTYKIGDRFLRRGKADEYIIAVAGNGSYSTQKQVVAINLRTGSRLNTAATPVCSLYEITRAELCKVMKVPSSYVRYFENWISKTKESGIKVAQ